MVTAEQLDKAVPAIERYLAAHAAYSTMCQRMEQAGEKPPSIDADLEAAVDALWFDHKINVHSASFMELEAAVARSKKQ